MLSFLGLKPRCPVTFDERIWLERRMRWLRDQLGEDRLKGMVVRRPSEDDFPELRGSDPVEIEPLFDRLADMMEVRQPVRIEVAPNEKGASDAGTYENVNGIGHIRIRESILSDHLRLVAVLVHELSHAVLLGEDHLDGTEPDMELLTDLATVFFGFGIFGANACLREHYERWPLAYSYGWDRIGYMSSPQFGYAMALFCWLRDEQPNPWKNDLRLDARENLTRGLRFLAKSDSRLLFDERPSDINAWNAHWENRLTTRSPAVHYDVLMDMSETPTSVSEPVLSLVRRDLDHHEVSIVCLALKVLAYHPEFVERCQDDVLNSLVHPSPEVCLAALDAIANVPRTQDVLAAVANLFHQRREPGPRVHAAKVLLGHGESLDDGHLVAELLKDVRTALLSQNEDAAVAAIRLIDELVDDAPEVLRERFGHTEDDEWFAEVMKCMEIAKQANSESCDTHRLGQDGHVP